MEAFAEYAEVLASNGKIILQYGANEGYGPLREIVQAWMADRLKNPVDSDELLITTGSQQVADLVGRALLNPGDVVLVEAPTYPSVLTQPLL